MNIGSVVSKVSILAMAATLAACGGEGGNVASTPPPPSPPPPPAATYTKIPDLTGTQTFQSASSGFRYGAPGGGSATPSSLPLAALGPGAVVTFNTATGDYSVSANGFSETFTQANIDNANTSPKVAFFTKRDAAGNAVSQLAVVTPSPGGVDLSYTRIGAWVSSADPAGARTYFSVGGMPTIASDMPRTGTATFGATVVGGIAFVKNPAVTTTAPLGAEHDLQKSMANFTADFGAGKVSSQLVLEGTLLGAPPTFPTLFIGNFVGGGTIGSGANSFTGTYTGLGNSMTGNFLGAFFGPQAAEYGLEFSLSGTFNGAPMIANGNLAGAQGPNTQLLP